MLLSFTSTKVLVDTYEFSKPANLISKTEVSILSCDRIYLHVIIKIFEEVIASKKKKGKREKFVSILFKSLYWRSIWQNKNDVHQCVHFVVFGIFKYFVFLFDLVHQAHWSVTWKSPELVFWISTLTFSVANRVLTLIHGWLLHIGQVDHDFTLKLLKRLYLTKTNQRNNMERFKIFFVYITLVVGPLQLFYPLRQGTACEIQIHNSKVWLVHSDFLGRYPNPLRLLPNPSNKCYK